MNGQHYYAILDTEEADKRIIFNDVEGIRNFLITYPNIKEIFHTGFLGITIICDTRKGEAILIEKHDNPGITTFFSKETFNEPIEMVEKAIFLFARYELLRRLFRLKDDGINTVIKKNQLYFAEGEILGVTIAEANNNHSMVVDRTLIEIQQFIIPEVNKAFAIGMRLFSGHSLYPPHEQSGVQQAVYNAFTAHQVYEHGIAHIQSLEHVNKIMKMIKEKVVEAKEKEIFRDDRRP